MAATVFQIGLLESADAADLGWALVPLQRLHGDSAELALRGAGVDVRLNCRVRDLVVDGEQWLVEGEAYDDVVVAAPPPVAEALLPPGTLDLAAGWAAELGDSPILNLHLHWDRRVLDEPFVAAVDSPLQWIFDRSGASGLDAAQGQYVAVSISAADRLADLTVADLRTWALPHLARLLPATEHAELKEFLVTREPHATFRPRPGSGRLRPPPTTRLPGLHLAGAWTDTGWPATMEGAVRSGEAAAASVRAHATSPVLAGGRR